MTEKKSYSGLLKDPRWQKKRLEVMQRDNFTCCLCKDDKITLHVHHLEYSGNPWDVEIKHLTTLCEHCHKMAHKIEKEHFKKIKSVVKKTPEEIYDIEIDCVLLFVEAMSGTVYIYLIDEEGCESLISVSKNMLLLLNTISNGK